ncbi:FAD-binding domain-containing protein [Glonium stellatum]|uniref:FAD-binding domain-containing protein n=1 Tax=Glonium stellatum TaxID=574774 RepID=A0A8E2JM18_9PEZI|nr:FAD-binding domain-containing protein [Glonium stellatum]
MLARASTALDRLREAVGDRLITVEPVAKPCYSNPGPLDRTQCGDILTNKTNDIFISNQPGGYFYSNWASCQSLGQGCAIPLSSSRISSNAVCFQGSVPRHMVNVHSVADIRAAFEYANSTRKPLVIKNTGHDWKGRSAAPDSLAVWTHNLRAPDVPILLNRSFVPEGCSPGRVPSEPVFHFGAGETWGGAYDFAEANNLAVLGGTCGTVGVSGWLHGGGHSPLTPVYGMGVDNVRQVKVVLPSGEEVTANECQNRHIYFAVRGGGGGTFGVVTNVTYKALPKTQIQEFTANLDGLDAAGITEFFEILTANAKSWSESGWGGYIKTNALNHTITILNPDITANKVEQDMSPLIAFCNKINAICEAKVRSSWYDYYKAYLQPTDAHVGTWSGAVASRLLPPRVFETESSRKGLVSTLLELHYSNLNLWIMLVTPTRFPHTTTSALHPSWKDAVWSVRINAKWDQYYDSITPSSNNRQFKKVHEAMEPIRYLAPNVGVSINEADIWEKDYEEAFWGAENYASLAKIKAEVDPKNLLSVWQGVGSHETDDQFSCYPQYVKSF